MSKSLVKIVDASLFPAALMVAGKFVGLYLTIKAFGFDWGVDSKPSVFFSSRPIFMEEDLLVASSYSDLFLIFVMIFGFSFHIIRAIFLHKSHIHPKLLTRLAMHGLLGLVKDSFEIYHRASVWLLFLWLVNVLVLINVLLGKTYTWVLAVGLAATIFLTIVLLRDVAYEIKIAKEKGIGD